MTILMALALVVTMAMSPGSPVTGGTVVKVIAQASGGSGNYVYRWWRLPIGPDGYQGVWSVIQDWSDNASVTYAVPFGGGDQYIGVWVMDSRTSEMVPASQILEAKPAPLPSCGPLSLSALGAGLDNNDGAHYLPLANKAYFYGSWGFPFTVPAGRTYRISSVHFLGKPNLDNNGVTRTGGVILTNMFSLRNDTPLLFPEPLEVPEGFTVDGLFSNDTVSSPMNMMVLVVGRLTGQGC